MGRKHRERRKQLKKLIRREIPEGWREDELGLLRKKISKAEARERYLRAWGRHLALRLPDIEMMLPQAEKEIMQLASDRALRELHEIEDAHIFNEVRRASEGAHP